MDNVLAHPEYHLNIGYVCLARATSSVEGNVTYLPVYMAGMFHNGMTGRTLSQQVHVGQMDWSEGPA